LNREQPAEDLAQQQTEDEKEETRNKEKEEIEIMTAELV